MDPSSPWPCQQSCQIWLNLGHIYEVEGPNHLYVELLLVPPLEVPLGLHDGSPWWFLVVLGLYNNHAKFRVARSTFQPSPNTPRVIQGGPPLYYIVLQSNQVLLPVKTCPGRVELCRNPPTTL